MRSCNWYCRKELVLGVGRVNEPGNLVWLKMAKSRQLLLKKYVRLGLGLTGWSSPVPSPLSCPLRGGCSCFWFDLGNPYRRLLRVGFFPCSLSVAPVGYEPKLGSLRLSVPLRSLGSRSNAFSQAMAPTFLGWWTEWWSWKWCS